MNTLILTIVAHLLSDFVFQTKWTTQKKRPVGAVVMQAIISTATTMVLVGAVIPSQVKPEGWIFFGSLLASRLLIDLIETYLMPNTWRAFLMHQFLHLAIIYVLCEALGDISADGIWAYRKQGLPVIFSTMYLRNCIIVGGYIVCCSFGGVLIGKLTNQISSDQAGKGIAGAGKYIGWLERAITMTLVLAGELAGIGFLITAKSILRFGNTAAEGRDKDDNNRKASEYIIIGTFLSFGWGLAVALLVQKILGL